MEFTSVNVLTGKGFEGFKTIEELFRDCSSIPRVKGVYMVIGGDNKKPEFVQNGVGGYFKGQNPNVAIDLLKAKWVYDTVVLYIGKAGVVCSSSSALQTLKKRISVYMKFGMGLPAAHYGGRYIWQLKGYKNLIVCWKVLLKNQSDPREYEKKLLDNFYSSYGKLPFANLKY